MFTIYRTAADELDEKFLESLRVAFRGKEIEIKVPEADETAYLLRSDRNRERLLKAVEDIEQGQNLIVPDEAQFR
ncbi:MAG TPA: hypothetical protein VGR78_10200 [Verrucomicrobiae bacterium]|jgi:antitoxin YefM|nr:hypothetical protein [Verrucomicrobiae bacterium]